MQLYWVWLALQSKISLPLKLQLLERFSDPEEIYHADDTALNGICLDRDLFEAEKIINICRRKGIGILPYGANEYPKRLRNIADPPLVLYYKGIVPTFETRPVIAVVGTRKASAYGLNTAQDLSCQIAQHGGLVVSGGAYGVDTKALAGAMKTDAPTVAVLGCGVDIVYPRTNRHLFDEIQKNGCLISEYLPGTEPKPWQFPERNRIISGMSDGVLVIEAPSRSGALITAQDALEQGRDVFVVPGSIDNPTCSGSNGLLREGATAVFSGWDVLEQYAYQYPQTIQKSEKSTANNQTDLSDFSAFVQETKPAADKKVVDNPAGTSYSVLENKSLKLTQQEQMLLACLDRTPRLVDDVIAQAQLPASTVLSMLTKLSLRGLVINHPGRLVSVRKQ